ncbi:signal recognition particle-docking protein FtsY [Candidatus Contubernalis alkaliaceticus]|uniref:signal recognition particle-docking protein FtsY n=1 Tax=Candidatus Contubernalis alkaliaceticus TaxID=338645 RepID=UPI001F4C3DE3|nr:signal recognition particle-docking protein FtsY [Candidatus Contubernalis alkalaceticus]UNC92749.1 signal recognition particle-docking protein FtsY [Candidatus Contubernalis alkalaceticus]
MGLLDKFKRGLKKTRESFVEKIDKLVKGKKISDEFYEELEEILIGADIGVETTLGLVEELKNRAREKRVGDTLEVKELLKEILIERLGNESKPLNISGELSVILVMGVNGVGKTTSIAKLAYLLKEERRRVMIAAGDTFRAAAIEQLEIWADRVGVDIIKHKIGSDPAAVIFDAISAAKARGVDVVLCDTAGRLHTKMNLMEELKKIYRVAGKAMTGAPQEVLLVLDATTGQNALSQAVLFGEASPITGIVLTKLDGTAKGGIVVAVSQTLKVPIKYVGIGESLEDLHEFNPRDFVEALFE